MNHIENNEGGNDVTNYMHVPFYLTSTTNGVYLTNTEYAVFDFGKKDKNSVAITVLNATLLTLATHNLHHFITIIAL